MDRTEINLERIRHMPTQANPTDLQERLALVRLRAKRGRRLRSAQPNVGYVAGKLRRKFLPKRVPMILRIKSYWPEIVGPKFARMCEPLKLTGGKLDKTLHIRVIPALALIIQHEEDAIKQRLNTMAGGHVYKISLHQGQIGQDKKLARERPTHQASRVKNQPLNDSDNIKLLECSQSINDPKLREAIEKLGRSMLSRD